MKKSVEAERMTGACDDRVTTGSLFVRMSFFGMACDVFQGSHAHVLSQVGG
jgi:hypothetical protein